MIIRTDEEAQKILEGFIDIALKSEGLSILATVNKFAGGIEQIKEDPKEEDDYAPVPN